MARFILAKLSPCCTMNVRGQTVTFFVRLTTICVVLLSVLTIAVDGLMFPHRKEEVPDNVYSRQVRGQSSYRLPDAKIDKKGISVNLVNILVDDDQSESGSSFVPSGAATSSTGTDISSTEQCSAVSEKVDCASYGIKKQECIARGCCYSEIRDGPDPWCYLPETSLVSQCRGREESRLQCGYYNIGRDDCNKLGCCWRPTSTSGTPWCYLADSETPRPDGSGDEAGSTSVECGVTPIEPNVNLRVVGGVEAVSHSWPWMVSLQYEGDHGCGGSLIADRWVLTAAHCYIEYVRPTDFTVVVGVHSLDSPDPTFTERFAIEKVILHPKYEISDKSVSNDIMLLKLDHPVNFSSAVLPICLPRHLQTITSGTRCWTTGWGRIEHGGALSNVLKQVDLPLLDRDVCNQEDWYNNEVDDTNICAGYEEGGLSSCHGDSGGPLACNVDGHWIVYGIVSWGEVCAREKKPTNFGRTSAYVKWIQRQIRENSD